MLSHIWNLLVHTKFFQIVLVISKSQLLACSWSLTYVYFIFINIWFYYHLLSSESFRLILLTLVPQYWCGYLVYLFLTFLFLIYAFKILNFHLTTALTTFQRFWYVVYFFSTLIVLYSFPTLITVEKSSATAVHLKTIFYSTLF